MRRPLLVPLVLASALVPLSPAEAATPGVCYSLSPPRVQVAGPCAGQGGVFVEVEYGPDGVVVTVHVYACLKELDSSFQLPDTPEADVELQVCGWPLA